MDKIKSPEDLQKLRVALADRVMLRQRASKLEELNQVNVDEHQTTTSQGVRMQIMVCGGTRCKNGKSDQIAANFRTVLEDKGLNNEIEVITTGCFGFCAQGPIVKMIPDNTMYIKVTPEDVHGIIDEHVVKGGCYEKLLYRDPQTKATIAATHDMPYYKKQVRIALRNRGFINPDSIEDYIARDGYMALGKCLKEYTPDQVVDLIKKSGLRGRGGGGFLTGAKWEAVSKAKGNQKYVICNVDEGDPGAFMDSDPFTIIEALTINAYTVGATNGFVFVRTEYKYSFDRLKTALEKAYEYGLLGDNILGTGFNFDLQIRYGTGGYICGEETAMLQAMEGLRGEPRLKPKYPALSGFKGFPTNINNAETLSCIPLIINRGAEWFASIGTETSKGTKIFVLTGKVNNLGLVEVPMGTTLREIIFEMGGGMKGGKKFKAAQIGGPTGGMLTEKHLDMPIDYETLLSVGSMMGSGALVVMDEDDCVISSAKFYLDFTSTESCGKCTPCRIGNKRLYEILDKITQGNGTEDDLEKLRVLSHAVKDASLCGLGRTAPNPVLSSLNLFYDECLEHVHDKRCRAGQCKSMVQYVINPENCVGCTACARNCPVNAIKGEKKMPHEINQTICIKCGACYQKCKFNAISIK